MGALISSDRLTRLLISMLNSAMMQIVSEWEILTRANQLRREHGDQSIRYVGERIAVYLMSGDIDQVKLWRSIEDRVLTMTHQARQRR